MTSTLLMGNEAFAHAALEAGVRVVAGYPGTPSSELIETVAKLHAQGRAHDVYVEWSTNEKAALELCAAASMAGARTLFTCKQVGLNVASDALMSLNYVGVKGGCVLYVADDPGPISSQTEQDTRRFAAFAKVPVLDPATPEQGFQMMKAAFELSEKIGGPVIVRPTTRICHASAFFDIEEETWARPVPEEGFVKDSRWVIFPKRSFEAHGEINERLGELAYDYGYEEPYVSFNRGLLGHDALYGAYNEHDPDEYRSEWEWTVEMMSKDPQYAPRVLIVAGGVSAAYAADALSELEELYAQAGEELPSHRLVQIGTPYPFPYEKMALNLRGVEQVLVFEELDHVIEDELLLTCGKYHLNTYIHGKLDGSTPERGENKPEFVRYILQKFFDTVRDEIPPFYSWQEAEAGVLPAEINMPEPFSEVEPTPELLPARPPVLCAGCPHRASFYLVKQALKRTPAVLCGDIGCYTLGNAQPLDALDTCLCMGAGITMAQGFKVAEPHKKTVAYIGDSTFFASGLTGIANAVYNQHDITVVVLDNSTTAMTGKQPHPGIGDTLMGARSNPISIRKTLEGLGVACITRANPLDLPEAKAALDEALNFEGPSAVLFEAPCIQLFRPLEPVMIDPDTCTGCKKCITSIGCPAIGFDTEKNGPASRGRGQAYIDTSLCYGCDLCVSMCPFDSIHAPHRAEDEEVAHE